MTTSSSAIDNAKAKKITLPETGFAISSLDINKVKAACEFRNNFLENLSLVLGDNGIMTLQVQEKILDELLAPFTTTMKSALINQIYFLAQPGKFSEESGQKLFAINKKFFSDYMPDHMTIRALKNKEVANKPEINKISQDFVDALNKFYKDMHTAMNTLPADEMIKSIMDTIFQHIALFHLDTVLKCFGSPELDQFVQEKITELVAHLHDTVVDLEGKIFLASLSTANSMFTASAPIPINAFKQCSLR